MPMIAMGCALDSEIVQLLKSAIEVNVENVFSVGNPPSCGRCEWVDDSPVETADRPMHGKSQVTTRLGNTPPGRL
jgi:hypothetical protein